ncbi:MAG: hypothetical protein WCG80_02095 [Spirochaetales bacterium]
MKPRNNKKPRNKIAGPVVVMLCISLLLVLSGSAVFAFPEGPAVVYDPAPRLLELTRAVHQHIRFEGESSSPRPATQTPSATLKRLVGTAQEQVLLLMAVTQKDLGLEPRLALIRLRPSGERRVVMEWRGLYYDPGLGAVYGQNEVAGVVRAVSYGSALTLNRL